MGDDRVDEFFQRSDSADFKFFWWPSTEIYEIFRIYQVEIDSIANVIAILQLSMVQRQKKLLVNGHEVSWEIKNCWDHFCYEIIQPRCVLITIWWVFVMIAIIRIKIQSRINSHFPKIFFISFSTTSSYLKTGPEPLGNNCFHSEIVAVLWFYHDLALSEYSANHFPCSYLSSTSIATE